MIRVRVQVNRRGEIRAFQVRGHAGFADRGQDIVCAGVSALAQSAVLGLGKFLAEPCTVKVTDGCLQCVLPAQLTEKEKVEAQAILETMLLGIREIESNYPRYVHLTEEKLEE